MFRDTTEWIKAVRNSSMNSKRQDRLIKEIQYYERAGVWNDKLLDPTDRLDQAKDSGTKSKGVHTPTR